MNNLKVLIKINLVVGVIALLMTIGEYLALHDILHDYVSKQVIEACGISTSIKLPDWSQAKLEWKMVNASGLIKFFYFSISIPTLVICLRSLKKHTGQNA